MQEEKEYDYAILFNTFRTHKNAVIDKANKIILLDLKFSLIGNPFLDVLHSHYENYKRDVIYGLKNKLLKDVMVVSDKDKLLNLVKQKKVVCDYAPGVYEEKLLQKINEYCELLVIKNTNTLLTENEFSLTGKFSFSKFRKTYESVLNRNYYDLISIQELTVFDNYLNSGKAFNYFDTRNALMDDNFSTRVSHLLNLGIVTPRDIITRVNELEKQKTNKSTYWIKFELLWREYFYWLYHANSMIFFQQQGFSGGDLTLNKILLSDYLAQMNTNPLIKAMNCELMQTGLLSNRSRQIYASFLINCTDLDWRYGAWFFQLYLKDFDLYSNWGNWLYLSGFGTDSKGPRFFNIVKQMKNYDPDLSYLKYWGEYNANSWKEITNT